MRVVVFDPAADDIVSQLSQLVPQAELIAAPVSLDCHRVIGNATGLIARGSMLTSDLYDLATRLRWVHLVAPPYVAPSDVVLTVTGGDAIAQMAELGMLLMLASVRKLSRSLMNQRMGVWDRWAQPLIRSKTVCIVGVGAVAEKLASILSVFGAKVTGVTRRAAVNGFTELYPRERIHSAVSNADIVIALCENSTETHKMIDESVIAAMRPDAHLIGLANGGVIDENALVEALVQNRIAGAAMDDFQTSPLRGDDPLWSVPNLIVSPRLGRFPIGPSAADIDIISQNLAAFCADDLDRLASRITAIDHKGY